MSTPQPDSLPAYVDLQLSAEQLDARFEAERHELDQRIRGARDSVLLAERRAREDADRLAERVARLRTRAGQLGARAGVRGVAPDTELRDVTLARGSELLDGLEREVEQLESAWSWVERAEAAAARTAAATPAAPAAPPLTASSSSSSAPPAARTGLPSWVLPAVAGAAVVLLLVLFLVLR